MTEGSNSQRPKNNKNEKGRRSWTEAEESCLITSMKTLITDGWRSDNGFRAGYLGKLEELMRQRFPNSDLRASPHIHSKLTMWKKNYYSLSNILNRSGVGFNVNGSFKIECEDESWEHILKTDPNARTMRYKRWPFYDEWKDIFGKDRANGDMAGDNGDAWNDIPCSDYFTGEGFNDGDYHVNFSDFDDIDIPSESMSAATGKSTDESASKRKNSKGKDKISQVCNILVDIGRKADDRLTSLVDSFVYEDCLVNIATSISIHFNIISSNDPLPRNYERIKPKKIDLTELRGSPFAYSAIELVPQEKRHCVKNYVNALAASHMVGEDGEDSDEARDDDDEDRDENDGDNEDDVGDDTHTGGGMGASSSVGNMSGDLNKRFDQFMARIDKRFDAQQKLLEDMQRQMNSWSAKFGGVSDDGVHSP